MRVLVACGAAGGIAATFNAPLAGVFFAMELILPTSPPRRSAMVVLAAVTAASSAGRRSGDDAVPAPAAVHRRAPRPSTVCSPCSGCSPGASASASPASCTDRGRLRPVLARARSGCARRSAACCSACCCSLLPQMYGVGYPVLGNAISGRTPSASCSCCWPGKMLATSLTIGIGGSGGVFAPSLFIGAMLGSAFGALAHQLLPGRRRASRRVRPGRHGRGLRRRGPRPDHRRGHHVRADRRVLDHPAADARHRPGHRHQPRAVRATPSTRSSCAAAASISDAAKSSVRRH